MKIKKYIAANFNEGKKLILAELGEDAVILSTRNINKPDSEETSVEIVAAIDEKTLKEKQQRPVKDKLSGLETLLNASKKEEKQSNPLKANNYEPKNDVYDEIYDIKRDINKIFDSLKYKFTPSLNSSLASVFRKIIDNEFSEEFALEILGEISSSGTELKYEDAIQIAKEIITKKIRIGNPLKTSSNRQVISFTGPTGSGKTMALVKLAIIMSLLGKKVLILSADTYKVGGAEQLSTYASIAGLPFKTVYSIKDLRKYLTEETEYDFVFLDTKGVSYRNNKHIFEISDYLKVAKPDKNFLVVNANMSSGSFREILKELNSFNYTDIILTKLDESAKIGGIISAIDESGFPITYLTYGQNIPDDISPANAEKLGHIALPLNNKIDIIKLLDE
ncbi:flagellar biosynthesis protein FlhF [Candidatus Kapabacteria bacterium]|nr:flagellar biosynthesis protein FlhF [Candidatus Kapabacteria bacterium]